jgi:hypothetical protein
VTPVTCGCLSERMPETATSCPAPNGDKHLVRVLEKRELLSQVLVFVGEGTEIALMLVCKDVCISVRLSRGWQEEKKENGNGKEKELKIFYGMSMSRVSCFLTSVGLAEWGAEVLGMPMKMKTTQLAVKGGHVCTLDRLLGKGAPLGQWSYNGACYWAAEAGHLPMLQYLRSREPPCPWDGTTCESAAMNGHLHVLQWARCQPKPCPWDENICTYAARNGHLEVLQWARSQAEPCPWDQWTCANAAFNGHLHVLQWARSQPEPCPWDWETCRCAAENGHLEVLQWARSQQEPCPWDENTCAYAAQNGHLEVLQWARSQPEPCPWFESTAKGASKWGIS